jgi:hypothetical protein
MLSRKEKILVNKVIRSKYGMDIAEKAIRQARSGVRITRIEFTGIWEYHLYLENAIGKIVNK